MQLFQSEAAKIRKTILLSLQPNMSFERDAAKARCSRLNSKLENTML
jgi:hypothetical protein